MLLVSLLTFLLFQPTQAFELPEDYLGTYQAEVSQSREFEGHQLNCSEGARLSISQKSNQIIIEGIIDSRPIRFTHIDSGPVSLGGLTNMAQTETYSYRRGAGFGIASKERMCHPAAALLGEVACQEEPWQQKQWLHFASDDQTNETFIMISYRADQKSPMESCVFRKVSPLVTPQ